MRSGAELADLLFRSGYFPCAPAALA